MVGEVHVDLGLEWARARPVVELRPVVVFDVAIAGGQNGHERMTVGGNGRLTVREAVVGGMRIK